MALNPISFTEQVVADFLRYQLPTYPLAGASLHAQMRALLRLEETRRSPLRRGPLISLSKLFEDGDHGPGEARGAAPRDGEDRAPSAGHRGRRARGDHAGR